MSGDGPSEKRQGRAKVFGFERLESWQPYLWLQIRERARAQPGCHKLIRQRNRKKKLPIMELPSVPEATKNTENDELAGSKSLTTMLIAYLYVPWHELNWQLP